MGYIIQNESMEEIQAIVDGIEKEINVMNAELEGLDEEKNTLSGNYEAAKEKYEAAKEEYLEKSSTGKYFLIICAVTFVIMAFLTISNAMIDFMMIPATALLVVAIVLRYLGIVKFKSLKESMLETDKAHQEAKNAYDEFMKSYNEKELKLEKKQYEWELVENDRIEARKEAWEAEHKVVNA